MNYIKSQFLEKEMDFGKKNQVRVFAVKVDNPSDLVFACRYIKSEINNAFLQYYGNPHPLFHLPQEPLRVKKFHEENLEHERDIINRAREEFSECNDKDECVVFYHEDLSFCYPEKRSIIEKRYSGIKILHL